MKRLSEIDLRTLEAYERFIEDRTAKLAQAHAVSVNDYLTEEGAQLLDVCGSPEWLQLYTSDIEPSLIYQLAKDFGSEVRVEKFEEYNSYELSFTANGVKVLSLYDGECYGEYLHNLLNGVEGGKND